MKKIEVDFISGIGAVRAFVTAESFEDAANRLTESGYIDAIEKGQNRQARFFRVSLIAIVEIPPPSAIVMPQTRNFGGH